MQVILEIERRAGREEESLRDSLRLKTSGFSAPTARGRNGEDEPYIQRITYSYEDERETVATALRTINDTPGLKDDDGRPVGQVDWESSCLQERCGACAMRINGVPRLACATKLSDHKEESLRDSLRLKTSGFSAPTARGRNGWDVIRLEPMRTFPVISDLHVDRSALYDSLREMRVWLERESIGKDASTIGRNHNKRGQISAEINLSEDIAYESSRCLQCGCCLEICPNYYAGGSFAGMAGMVPSSRVMTASDPDAKRLKKAYRSHIYEGCGKSLACRDICPAGIPIEQLLVRANSTIW